MHFKEMMQDIKDATPTDTSRTVQSDVVGTAEDGSKGMPSEGDGLKASPNEVRCDAIAQDGKQQAGVLLVSTPDLAVLTQADMVKVGSSSVTKEPKSDTGTLSHDVRHAKRSPSTEEESGPDALPGQTPLANNPAVTLKTDASTLPTEVRVERKAALQTMPSSIQNLKSVPLKPASADAVVGLVQKEHEEHVIADVKDADNVLRSAPLLKHDLLDDTNSNPGEAIPVSFRARLKVAESVEMPADTFQPFVFRGEQNSETFKIRDETAIPETTELTSLPAASEPIKRLELQWNDASLGKISLTAEMRNGELHAVVNSLHAASGVSANDLHRFLEESHIPLNGLQVNGSSISTTAAKSASVDSSTMQTGMSMGDRSQSFSQREQEKGHPHAGAQTRWHAEDGDVLLSHVRVPAAAPAQLRKQGLSIHI